MVAGTYYDILGITPKAPPEVIAAVYRAWMKALRVHPDLGGDEELAKRINAAYEVLKDPQRRAVYDAQLARQSKLPEERRRRAPRKRVSSPIAYCLVPERCWRAAHALDASALGLRFRCDMKLKKGDHLAIAFRGRAASAIEATVRWSRACGADSSGSYEVGVEFFFPAPEVLKWLGCSDR
jgi:curved DNA-binding protein CbpA